jgi:transposase InsO family protein
MNTLEWSLILRFFPKKKISEVPVRILQQELISIFKIRGIPDWIKVDNGRPFGDPQLELIPPLALWLIGLGIKVIWNRPATPQDNGVVERSQGVMSNWTDFARCKNVDELQVRLRKEADFHNLHFPIRRKGNKTRIELFPKLMHTGRDWNPHDFKLNRVLIFLAKAQWERKVTSNGQISIYGQRFSVGMKYKHQRVSLKLNPRNNHWNIFDDSGYLIKKQPAPFSQRSIWNLDFS